MNYKFWGKGMAAKDFHASPYEMAEAFHAWNMATGYHGLAQEIERIQPMFAMSANGREAAWRIADRMIQKARRAGFIEPVKNGRDGWRKAEATQ